MIIKEIINRRSVREYDAKDVPQDYITEIIKAGQFAPSAHNNHAIDFVVVRGDAKEKIFELTKKSFIKEAPVLIIPAADKERSPFPVQDLSVATENMFLQAASFGLGTLWKNVDPELELEIKKILNIPANYKIINMILVGFPKEPPGPHLEGDFDSGKIHNEKW